MSAPWQTSPALGCDIRPQLEPSVEPPDTPVKPRLLQLIMQVRTRFQRFISRRPAVGELGRHCFQVRESMDVQAQCLSSPQEDNTVEPRYDEVVSGWQISSL